MIADLTFDEDVEIYDELEDFDDDDESYDDEEFDDDDEGYDDDEAAEIIGAFLPGPLKFLDPIGAGIGAAAGRGRKKRRRPRPRTARARGLYRRPPSRKYVTQKQLQASLARVRKSIRKNGRAITKVNRQAGSNRTRLNQQNRINVRQGRSIRALRKEMDQQAQTQLLSSLLNQTEEVEVTASSAAGIPVGTTLTLERELDPITFLLPALSGGGSGGSGMNNPLLLFALMGR